ncbi:MAG: adenylyl-sulfate kinase [Candidatus Uhrbacteria bacterium]|nr:adenylyl-sulfate kinase [Candidatus Uhrbacteria bacterium]
MEPILLIKKEDGEPAQDYSGFVIWLTGFSGSGKSTIAKLLERRLKDSGVNARILDGDVLREGLNCDLGFSKEDRSENIRRAYEVAHILIDSGVTVISAFISPYRSDRERARECVGSERFIEVHVDCPIDICESRDPKGLYAKVRSGEISNFTGINDPYEVPEDPDVIVKTHEQSIEECVNVIIDSITSQT